MDQCYSDVGKILSSLGIQVRRLRLRNNMSQEALSKVADVGLNVIKRLESGKGATLGSFIRVLVVFDKVQWLDMLSPVVSISPIDMLKLGHERKRCKKQKNILVTGGN